MACRFSDFDSWTANRNVTDEQADTILGLGWSDENCGAQNLEAYWSVPAHRDAEGSLKSWHYEVKMAQWSSPQDVKDQYANASVVGNNRIVFNIKGNDYRLIVAIAYKMQYVYVKFIGTHTEYNKVDATTVDQFKGA